jgi:hypothetical protein
MAFEATLPNAERSGDVLRAGDRSLRSAWNLVLRPSSTSGSAGWFGDTLPPFLLEHLHISLFWVNRQARNPLKVTSPCEYRGN